MNNNWLVMSEWLNTDKKSKNPVLSKISQARLQPDFDNIEAHDIM